MQYGSYFFCDNGDPTITRISGDLIDAQRRELSNLDITTARFMYPN